MYEHGDQGEITRQARGQAEEVLRQLCRDTAADIRPDTPRIFSSLVTVMRRVDASGLKALHAKLEQNTLCADNIRTKYVLAQKPRVLLKPRWFLTEGWQHC